MMTMMMTIMAMQTGEDDHAPKTIMTMTTLMSMMTMPMSMAMKTEMA